MRAIGYTRVSTAGQVESGAGLADQEAAIRAECEHRGWELVRIASDPAVSGKSLDHRPELAGACAALDAGGADVLVAAKLDRLARSVLDFASLMARADARHWALVALDVNVDTTTPTGELMATVIAAFAQYERRLIGQRTRAALAQKRAAGVVLGRPRTLAPAVRARICSERAAGRSLRAIADALNAEAVPTAQGGSRWHASTVRHVAAA
ncbi:MAG TPA: recombinase family protein [Acidimicrobiales bacterium]|nr:recombinase family protein [Acidimicrobiales bacterium]